MALIKLNLKMSDAEAKRIVDRDFRNAALRVPLYTKYGFAPQEIEMLKWRRIAPHWGWDYFENKRIWSNGVQKLIKARKKVIQKTAKENKVSFEEARKRTIDRIYHEIDDYITKWPGSEIPNDYHPIVQMGYMRPIIYA